MFAGTVISGMRDSEELLKHKKYTADKFSLGEARSTDTAPQVWHQAGGELVARDPIR